MRVALVALMLPRLVIITAIAVIPTMSYAKEPPDEDDDPAEEYASQGTFEAGGSIGVTITDDVTTVTASPSLGYFIADHIEITGIFAMAYTRVDDDETGETTSNMALALLIEPSYHQPISDNLLVEGGLALGFGFDGDFFDLEIVPTAGIEILVGRSSVITPAVHVPILIGKAHGDDGDVGTEVGVAIDIGITTTW